MTASRPGQNWQDVWNARTLDPSRGSTLAQLMAADGLDTAFGTVGEEAWRAFVRTVAGRLALDRGSTVFEVGCGAGAFLYEIDSMGCQVGGIDRSAVLIDYAKAAIPRGRFDVAEAAALDILEPADAVVSCAVFLYFPSLSYAERVLERMASKARRAVAILDLPDAARQREALASRRHALGEEVYDRRYEGLEHLFFDRDWIARELARCGVGDIQIEDQDISGYANGVFRFNAFGFKRAI